MTDAGDVVERSDVGEEGDFFFVEGGDAEGEVVDGREGAVGAASGDDGFSCFFFEGRGRSRGRGGGQVCRLPGYRLRIGL